MAMMMNYLQGKSKNLKQFLYFAAPVSALLTLQPGTPSRIKPGTIPVEVEGVNCPSPNVSNVVVVIYDRKVE
jgi:hypothetical protein